MRSNHTPTDQHSRIPLTVIAGEANAGKSSLVRHLLASSRGRRLAAVVASEGLIDPALIARREGHRFILHNGCVCVVAEDDGAAALAKLAEQNERPDHVLLDGNGATNPRRLTGFGYMPGYCLDGTILVTEPLAVCRCNGDSTAEWQLREHASVSEVVLLNKIDRVSEGEAEEAQRIIERIAPATRVVYSTHSRISPALLLGPTDDPKDLDSHAVVAEWTSDYVPTRARGRQPAKPGPNGEEHRSWCLVSDFPTDGRAFRGWVQRLPTAIMSGRGSVYLREEPQHRHAFHYLGSRWRLERGAPWGEDTPTTRLVLAGLAGAPRSPSRSRGSADDGALTDGDAA